MRDKLTAKRLYERVLGLTEDPVYKEWNSKTGPLTLSDASGRVHFALFEVDEPKPTNVWAFGATGSDWLAWRAHLKALAVPLRLADHGLTYSLYFSDPFGHQHEITTAEVAVVRTGLAQ